MAALLATGGCHDEADVAAGSLAQSAASGTAQQNVPEASAGSGKSPAPVRGTGISGKWLARSEVHHFTIELTAEGQALRGCVRTADGSVMAIKIGVFTGDAFLFETSSTGAGWLWSGEFSNDGLHGFRENVQTGAVEPFTAERSE
jgi:hypothetical protein